jgi:hypothetical protein
VVVHSEYRNGALVFYDGHRKRIVDAVGENVRKYIMGPHIPMAGADTPAGFTVTLVEAGADETTVAPLNGSGGGIVISSDENDNDGANIQLTGEPFKLVAGNIVYFRCKLKCTDATQSDFLVGLCITDTTLLGGLTDGVYFEKLDGGTGVSFTVEKDSTETQADSLATFEDDVEVDLELYWDGAALEAFIDGASVAVPALTNLPDDEELTLSVHFLAGVAAVGGKTLTITKLAGVQIGVEA